MRRVLIRHPETPSAAVGVAVDVVRSGAALSLRYTLTGDIAALSLRAPLPPRRRDELWRHSCFEAFLRAPDHPGYVELNLSPSTEWQAYRLSGYRAGLTPVEPFVSPTMAVERAGDRLVLAVEVDLRGVEVLPAGAPWSVGLTAVIEAMDGSKSYWALAHPPGAPDFHHPDCFALELPAPEQP